jgi:hypothetical protein
MSLPANTPQCAKLMFNMLIDRINNGGLRVLHSSERGAPLSPVHRQR